MTWPEQSDFSSANVDSATDSPAAARGDIYNLMQAVKEMIGARGIADGIASLDANGRVPIGELPRVRMNNGCFVDSTPGSGKTWQVPVGVYRVRVTVCGGGGGGGYTSTGTGGDHGGGGGAGGVAIRYFDVVPQSVFNYTVGAGGQGHSAASDGDGQDGESSTCISPGDANPPSFALTGFGGEGGKGPPDCFGGGGGTQSGGEPGWPGGAGGSGETRGGMGGCNHFTGGSAGGSGYGGGGGFGSGGGTPGFAGLDGFVMFEW